MSFAITIILLLIGGAVITRVVLLVLRRRQDGVLSRFLLLQFPQLDASRSVRSQQLRRCAYATAATALCAGAVTLFGELSMRYGGDTSLGVPLFLAGVFIFGLLAVMAGMIAIAALIRALTGK